mmetsp:Transcript_42035/g.121898  ORF Transcript_42035/g.121898 Transcript_42035/m.121898 type:complete len:276 (+) Transcript_42035:598-1425(+)
MAARVTDAVRSGVGCDPARPTNAGDEAERIGRRVFVGDALEPATIEVLEGGAQPSCSSKLSTTPSRSASQKALAKESTTNEASKSAESTRHQSPGKRSSPFMWLSTEYGASRVNPAGAGGNLAEGSVKARACGGFQPRAARAACKSSCACRARVQISASARPCAVERSKLLTISSTKLSMRFLVGSAAAVPGLSDVGESGPKRDPVRRAAGESSFSSERGRGKSSPPCGMASEQAPRPPARRGREPQSLAWHPPGTPRAGKTRQADPAPRAAAAA